MRHPVEAIAKITAKRERVINVVDAVSALGAFDLPMDAAGFDVLLTGSQKALMLPPGQAYIALSDKAWARTESADLPRFYCDLKREKKAQAGGETAWTPAITLTVGLVEALRMIKEEGLAAMFRPSRAPGRGHARTPASRSAARCSRRRAVADGDVGARDSEWRSTPASSSSSCATSTASRSPAARTR